MPDLPTLKKKLAILEEEGSFMEKIIARKKTLFELRLKKSRGENIKPHMFKKLKHEIAQLSYYYHKSLNRE